MLPHLERVNYLNSMWSVCTACLESLVYSANTFPSLHSEKGVHYSDIELKKSMFSIFNVRRRQLLGYIGWFNDIGLKSRWPLKEKKKKNTCKCSDVI